jgi:maleylpyruvate isomerase
MWAAAIAAAHIQSGLVALEVLASPTDPFCAGDFPTIADCCLVPQLHSARRFKVDLTPFPRLVAIEARCAALPAFQRAHADAQPDAEQGKQP